MRKPKYKNRLETPWSNITEVLPSVFHNIEKAKRKRPKNLDAIWKMVVDEAFLKYTRVECITKGVLYIKVLSGSVYSELVMKGTEEVEKKIKNYSGFSSIKRVVYRR